MDMSEGKRGQEQYKVVHEWSNRQSKLRTGVEKRKIRQDCFQSELFPLHTSGFGPLFRKK